MAKSRAQKEAVLESYKEILKQNSGFFALDVKGVDTSTITELKMKLKELGSDLVVVKNTIFRLALSDSGLPEESQDFAEQTAIISYENDPTVPAKLLKEYQGTTEGLAARYGILNGAYLNAEKVTQLADVPSREQLLSMLLGTMVAPVSGFMSVANGNTRGFTRVLQQLSERSEN